MQLKNYHEELEEMKNMRIPIKHHLLFFQDFYIYLSYCFAGITNMEDGKPIGIVVGNKDLYLGTFSKFLKLLF